jgi:hypothetical protein
VAICVKLRILCYLFAVADVSRLCQTVELRSGGWLFWYACGVLLAMCLNLAFVEIMIVLQWQLVLLAFAFSCSLHLNLVRFKRAERTAT